MKINDIEFKNNINTLYVSRPLDLKSAKNLKEWAKSVGFNQTLDPSDMHVTLAFSKKPIEWSLLKPALNEVTVLPGNRSISPLGDKGAVVLKINCLDLTRRWNQFINIGCSWDYKNYDPHITISYNGPVLDTHIDPYDEPITLLPEKWALVQLDWDKKIKES